MKEIRLHHLAMAIADHDVYKRTVEFSQML